MPDRGVWKKEIHSIRFKFFVGLAVMTFIGLFIVLTYDYMMKLLEVAPIPQYAREQFGAQIEMMRNYRYYVWSQWFAKNFLQVGSILAIVFGAGMGNPVSSRNIFNVKYVVSFVSLALAGIFATVVMYAGIIAAGHFYPMVQLIEHTVVSLAGLAVIFSIAAYFSTVFDQTLKSGIVSALVAGVMFIPSLFAGVQEYSVFYQMQGVEIVTGKGFPIIPFSVMLLLSGGLFWLARNRFSKKDF